MADKVSIYDENGELAEGVERIRTQCYFCHANCGVLAYVKDGDVIKIEGDPDYSNQGGLCCRGTSALLHVNHPARINHALKRAGEKGENKWEQISWEEALDTCYREFKRISMTYGGDAIHCHRGTARDNMWQVGRLGNTFNCPNECGVLSGLACYLPRVSLMIMSYGGMQIADMSQFFARRYEDPNWVCPECTIVWGCNPTISNPDFYMGHWVTDVMKMGCKLISVEPRVTWLAAHADIHVRLRPGTDTYVAMGMLKVMIEEDLYDHDFVDRWTYGFDELSERARSFSLEDIEKITWVPKATIEEAARMFATSKPANIVWGLAIDMQSQGTPTAQAVAALWAITGNLDVPGGMCYTAAPMGVDQPSAGGWGYYDLLSEDMMKKRVGWMEFPMYRYGLTQSNPDIELLEHQQGKFKGAWVQCSNAIACMSLEVEGWYEAMKGLEFVAAVDIFMTPTIQACADIVMPAQTWAEKHSVRAHYYFLSAITGSCAVEGEALSDCEINRRLGRKFDADEEFKNAIGRPLDVNGWPWETEDEVYDEILKPSGFTFDELRENGPVYQKYEYRKYETGGLRPDGQPGFNTPTGRIELWSTLLDKFGYDPLPYAEEPGIGPITTPDLFEDYPLIMITGARTTSFFHSEHRQVPRMRNLKKDNNVYLNPKTAEEYGLKNGEWVWVENVYGRCKAQVEVTNLYQDPRVIACDHAWWHPEGDAEGLYESHDLNVNNLLPGIPGRAGFGSNYKTTLVKLYKVTPEDDSNGCFPSPDTGYVSQAMDGKGVKAIEELVDERAQIMRDREAVKKAIAEAQAEQA